ncbi:MAG: HipA domain-containing protein [Gulosibacter sp.]|uniref:HipA domain-containing protein n=1 Tax=Gulosibacter sp. TaxID=2817531 RepID=UPI003F93D0A5
MVLNEATTHIVKPGVLGLRSQALTEHVSMRALQLTGLSVANSHFERFAGEPAIVVERYDRYRYEGVLYRVHQEDLCQATSTLPRYKYNVTAKQVVDTLRAGGADEVEVGKFVQAVLANWLIGAPDAHAKNYSVLLTPEWVQLAPLYDVATGFGQEEERHKMAMEIGGASTIHEVASRHLEAFASDLGLDPSAVLISADVFAQLIPAAFAQAISELDLPSADRSHLEQINAEITQHCERVRNKLAAA